MKGLLLAAALFLTVDDSAFAQNIPDGTVLFVENSSLLVETVTDFQTTHVCVILDGKVYNAEPGHVRTYDVAEYLKLIAKANEGVRKRSKSVFCYPKRPFTRSEIAQMRAFLKGEVGRRYSLRGYVRGDESDGTHCSQLTVEALAAAGRVRSDKPWTISPGSLRLACNNFCKVRAYYLVEKNPPPKKMWFRRFGDWLYDRGKVCSWSCYETWTFCE